MHYYARWKLIGDLLPALKKAKEAGEDAKVLSVLAAAKGAEIDEDDIGFKKTYSFIKARTQVLTYNDLMMEVNYSLQDIIHNLLHYYRNMLRKIQIWHLSMDTQDLFERQLCRLSTR